MDFHSACCSTARAKWRSASSKAKRRWTASRPRWTSQMITTNKQCRIILDKWIRILEYWWFLLHCQMRFAASFEPDNRARLQLFSRNKWVNRQSNFQQHRGGMISSELQSPTYSRHIDIDIYIYIYIDPTEFLHVLLNSELHEFTRNMEIGWHWSKEV